MHTIKVVGVPVPQGSMMAVNNRIIHQNSAKLKAWRSQIAVEAMAVIDEPFDCAVEVSLMFFLERPKTVVRKFPSVKPDVDKLARSCLDALTGVAYEDDSQVVTLDVTKRYATDFTGVIICIDKIGIWDE